MIDINVQSLAVIVVALAVVAIAFLSLCAVVAVASKLAEVWKTSIAHANPCECWYEITEDDIDTEIEGESGDSTEGDDEFWKNGRQPPSYAGGEP